MVSQTQEPNLLTINTKTERVRKYISFSFLLFH